MGRSAGVHGRLVARCVHKRLLGSLQASLSQRRSPSDAVPAVSAPRLGAGAVAWGKLCEMRALTGWGVTSRQGRASYVD